MLPEAGAAGPARVLQALGGSFIGYLSGCGIVWAVRMFGTLAFGREAMGLGDVHLMGAVGAVLGWFDPLVVFFLAPFFGLAWVFVAGLVSRFTRKQGRELPYGPHLAAATVVLFFARPMFVDAWQVMVPTIPMPQRVLEPLADPKMSLAPSGHPEIVEFPDPFLDEFRPSGRLNGRRGLGMVASTTSPDPLGSAGTPVVTWMVTGPGE